MLTPTGLGLKGVAVMWGHNHCPPGWRWGEPGEETDSLDKHLSVSSKGKELPGPC